MNTTEMNRLITMILKLETAQKDCWIETRAIMIRKLKQKLAAR